MARTTLESVARRAYVSRQTVSNVLNAPHRVRPETAARVQAAIDELGYRPNWAARTLRTRRSRLISARIEPPPRDGANAVVLERFLHALAMHTQAAGYRMLVFTADGDQAEIAAYERMLGDQDLDALVVTGTHADDPRTRWLTRRHVPFVTFGRPWGVDRPGHSWVDVDNVAGARAATEHLIRRGHRRIAFLGWPRGSGVGDARRSGWAAACRAAGLDTRLTVAAQDGVGIGHKATSRLLDLADPPTAVVCASDSFAIGAWSAIAARGGRPGGNGPHDVAVVGYDDSPPAAVMGLSSVAQPHEQAARWCVRLLRHVLEPGGEGQGDDWAPELEDAAVFSAAVEPGSPPCVLLPPHLVVRSSS